MWHVLTSQLRLEHQHTAPARHPDHMSKLALGCATKTGAPCLSTQIFVLEYSHEPHCGWLVHRLQQSCIVGICGYTFACKTLLVTILPLYAVHGRCPSHLHSHPLSPTRRQWCCRRSCLPVVRLYTPG